MCIIAKCVGFTHISLRRKKKGGVIKTEKKYSMRKGQPSIPLVSLSFHRVSNEFTCCFYLSPLVRSVSHLKQNFFTIYELHTQNIHIDIYNINESITDDKQ